MAEIAFYCPNADLRVRHLLDPEQNNDEELYESILCFACTRLHFINKKTGELLGPPDAQALAVTGTPLEQSGRNVPF